MTLSFRALLLVLLAIDMAFILANILAVLAFDVGLIARVPLAVKITEDLAPPESFNYLKWLVIAVALIWISIRDRWLAPVLWAVVFAMILIDDSFQVHEYLGQWLSSTVIMPTNALLLGTDMGELLVFATMGLITLSILGILFTRKDRPTRDMTMRYSLVVVALGFFAVGLDAAHSIVSHATGGSSLAILLQQVFGMIEDGGEMIVGSLAVAMTLAPAPPEDAKSP